MAVDPATLQSLAQNRLAGQLSLNTPPPPSTGAPATFQPYRPPPQQTNLADPEAPLQARRQQLNTQMSNPSQDPRYRAFEDTVTQQGAAAKEQAQEHLRGAADPLAVQRQLQQYDFNTQAQLANRAADLFSQANQEQGQLATQTSGLRQTQAQQAQQAGQFGASLGEQSGQFGASLANNQNQFGQSQAQQAGQFGQTLANQQGQFGQTFGLQEREVNNQQNQFNQRLGEYQREYNESLAENQRQFNSHSRASGLGQQLAGSVLGGIASIGLGAPLGQAVGNFVNDLFGNSHNGETEADSRIFTSSPSPSMGFGNPAQNAASAGNSFNQSGWS